MRPKTDVQVYNLRRMINEHYRGFISNHYTIKN